jgi:protein-disulfide isomerase
VLFGCARNQDAVAPTVSAPAVASAGATHARCDRAQEIICATAGNTSKECESAKSTFKLMPKSGCALSSEDESALKANVLGGRERCNELVMRLCRDLGEQSSSCDMVTTQTKVFPASRCEMMLSRYNDVLAELRKMEKANRPLTTDEQRLIAATTGPAFGSPDAKVVIVVFADFQCPFCAKAAEVLRQIRANYPSGVRLVFRQFPLKFHADARLAAEAALAAHAQGKFWELHDTMFESNKALSRSDLERYAVKVGLELKRFNKDLDAHRFAAQLDADIKLGEQVSVSGTPTMFIGATRVQNPTDMQTVMAQIKTNLGQ